MDTIIKNHIDKLNYVSGFFSELATNPSMSIIIPEYEIWLKEQIQKITALKHKIKSYESLNQALEKADGGSVIVFDGNMRIKNYSGAFEFFIGSEVQLEKDFALLEFIADSKHAGIFSMLKQATGNKISTSETILKCPNGLFYKTAVEIEPDNDKSYFRMTIYDTQMIRNSLDHDDFPSMVLRNLPGTDVLLYDHNYRCILCGGKEKEKYGHHDNDIIGKTLFEVFKESTQKKLYPFLNKALNGIDNSGEIRILENIYAIDAAPVKDENGFTIAATLTARNITEEKLSAERLRKSIQEARNAEKEKSLFLANISHEIRTPLNAIIGFSEQLGKTELNERQGRYNQLVQKASDHLLYLVDEVAFLFKLETGKVFIEKTSFDLSELFNELNEEFTPKAFEKEIRFDVQLDKGIPIHLINDPYRIRQILLNLLVNAFKYTDSGRVTLSCKLLKQTKKTIHLEFSVSDTGIGISKKDLPHIFEIFRQAKQEKYVRHQESGLGLGLGICLKLAKLLNGDIKVESALHKGTIFKVRLPFEVVKEGSDNHTDLTYV
jgi:signal transduction histidine kinase